MIILFQGIEQKNNEKLIKLLNTLKINLKYFKPSNHPNDYLNNNLKFDQFSYLLDLLEQTNLDNLILNDWLSSQYIENKIQKKEFIESRFWSLDIQMSKLKQGVKGIYTFKNYNKINYDGNINFNDLEKYHLYYCDYITKTQISFLKLNITNKALGDLMSLILFFLFNQKLTEKEINYINSINSNF